MVVHVQLDCLIYTSFVVHSTPRHGGFDPFPSPSLLDGLNPNSSPISPPGFGTGHSLFGFGPWICAIIVLSPSSLLSSTAEASLRSPSFLTHFRLRLLL
jgi:hypothetical protein